MWKVRCELLNDIQFFAEMDAERAPEVGAELGKNTYINRMLSQPDVWRDLVRSGTRFCGQIFGSKTAKSTLNKGLNSALNAPIKY